MFTGIIEHAAAVTALAVTPSYRTVSFVLPWTDIRLGESIAVNGVCLTVSKIARPTISFDIIPETVRKTNFEKVAVGDLVNLERSLRVGDRIDGHFVQGHIDGVASIIRQATEGNERRIVAEAPDYLAKYLVPKGSICLDGVSLTIAALEKRQFEVALIPTTLKMTTLGNKPVGWPLNLEVDIFSKTIVTHLERRRDWVEDRR